MNTAKEQMNTEDFKKTLGEKIKNDGINLEEFAKEQKEEIIKMYAAVLLIEQGY